MAGLLREMLKPLWNYFRHPGYKEWLQVKSACRDVPKGMQLNVKIAGFSVKTKDASSLLHLYEEIFVNKSFDVNFEHKNPLIYCCGANIGLELFFFKKHFPESRIHAFEADPEIAKTLEENVRSNQLTNITVHAAAVAAKNGTIAFQSDGGLGGKTGAGTAQIPCMRLAELLANETTIDLLLMDIEGAETEVLSDCAPHLPKVKRLFVEWHGAENAAQELPAFLQLLSSSGFRYRLNNKLPVSPFRNRLIEGGFDAMVEIYAERKS